MTAPALTPAAWAATLRAHGYSGEVGLLVSDLTGPYEFAWEDTGGSRAFQVPYGVLGLPPDVVRRAAPRLGGSPLHDLVRDTTADLGLALVRIEPDQAHLEDVFLTGQASGSPR